MAGTLTERHNEASNSLWDQREKILAEAITRRIGPFTFAEIAPRIHLTVKFGDFEEYRLDGDLLVRFSSPQTYTAMTDTGKRIIHLKQRYEVF